MLVKDRIKQLRENNPCMVLREIGECVGVSRERVRQVLNKAQLRTRAWSDLLRICPNCDKEFQATNRKSIHCSRSCQAQFTWIPIICDTCGVLFYRRQSVLMANLRNPNHSFGYTGEHYFCSRSCFAKWLGENHGFGRRG